MKMSPLLAFAALAISVQATAQIRSHKDESREAPEVVEQSAPGAVKPSKAAYKAIVELQKAAQGADTATFAAALAAAKAAATSKEDRYLIARLELSHAVSANDFATMRRAIDEVAASGFLDAAQTAELYSGLGGSLYSAKQYDQAAAAFERALALNPARADVANSLAETRFAQGRKGDSAAMLEKAIKDRLASGQTVDEATYRRAFEVAYTARSANAVDLGRLWLAAYPSAASWRHALAAYLNLTKPPVDGTVALLRLMDATGSLSNPADYRLLATAAIEQGNYSEAQAILDRGKANGSIKADDKDANELFDYLRAKPKATMADLEEATRGSSTPAAYLRIGNRYYGMGQYAKAVELFRMAEGKPGADASMLNLNLGMALARSGDKAGADAAFAKVTGALAPIAAYWRTYVKQMA